MSYAQARAISRVAMAENEALWVRYAQHMPASQLDTLCRSYQNVQAYDQAHGSEAGAMAGAVAAAQVAAQRTVTRRTLDNGMVKFEIVVASDEAAIVWAALNAASAGAGAELTPADSSLADPSPAEPTRAELRGADPTLAEPPSEGPSLSEPLLATSSIAKAPTSADRGRQRADAFIEIIQDRMCGGRPQRTPIEIIITVPHAGLHGCAQPANRSPMRAVATAWCDARRSSKRSIRGTQASANLRNNQRKCDECSDQHVPVIFNAQLRSDSSPLIRECGSCLRNRSRCRRCKLR